MTLVDARVGYAWDRLLVYAKGGGAFAGVSNSNGTVGTTVVNISSPGSNSGWTAGAGLEYAFWGTWSVRAEYDFVSLNTGSYTRPGIGEGRCNQDVISSNNRVINIVTVGLNYKFGGW